MTDAPAKPVLLTGASGNLGRMLTKALAAEGWTLRLTDITPFPDPVPARRDVHPRRSERWRDDPAPGGGLRRDRPSRRRIGRAAVRGSARPEHSRPVSHLRSRAARTCTGDFRLVQPFHRLSRTHRIDWRRHAIPARRVLRPVQGLRRTDGPLVLVQARRRERLHPHRLLFPGANQCTDARELAVVSRPRAAGGTVRDDREGRLPGRLGRLR